MGSFRFIHASDLHLGTVFEGLKNADADMAELMTEATYKAFDNLVELAVREGVDFVLLAGDLVDSEDRNLRALLRLQRGFSRLGEHGIQVLVVHGNHDPLSAMSKVARFPENVAVFPASPQGWLRVKTREGAPVFVWGMSYAKKAERRNLARLVPPPPSSEGFMIGLLHCTVGSGQGHEPYAACNLTDLIRGPCHYWALGHIHRRAVLSEDPLVVYAGNIQGRSFKEQGRRGCFVVRVEGGMKAEARFVETAVARWTELTVDVTAHGSESELMEAMFRAVEQEAAGSGGRALVCRVRLVGLCHFHERIFLPESLEEMCRELHSGMEHMEPAVTVTGIVDETVPSTDLERRKMAKDLVAYVLREADRLDKGVEGLAGPGGPLWQLLGNRRFSRLGIGLDEEELRRIVDTAQHLLVHLLEEPDDR